MRELYFDAVVIGGGAAGMAAALELDERGFSCAIVEREDFLGGILMQCIHNGFGLHEFSEDLTGPEFAERFADRVTDSKVEVFLHTTVTKIDGDLAPSLQGGAAAYRKLLCVSPEGVVFMHCKAVVLAMGCREKNRGNVRIPGSRPAGVFTAGLAQRLVNIEGCIPGKEIVIIGSGDIGLIMARRMSLIGCSVKAVVEIMPYPAGLARNIVQCLNDFNIPLYLSCQTTSIIGNDRVQAVEITPMENGVLVSEKRFRIDCDTVLLSVGLVPENELSREAGVELHGATGGPLVNSGLMTNLDGVFACGNVLHVHDLVDWTAEESKRAGRNVAGWLGGFRPESEVRVKAGSNVRYVNPGRIDPGCENKVYLRPLVVKTAATLELRIGGHVLRRIKKTHLQPSEMISVTVGSKDFKDRSVLEAMKDSPLEFSIV